MIRCQLPIGFAKKRVLILCSVPTIRERSEPLNGALRGSVVGRCGRQVQKHDVLNRVALTVVVTKEKRLILDNRAAHASTKLVEVVWRPASRRCCNLVDHVVSIQRFVTVKPETSSVKFVSSGFRHNTRP